MIYYVCIVLYMYYIMILWYNRYIASSLTYCSQQFNIGYTTNDQLQKNLNNYGYKF